MSLGVVGPGTRPSRAQAGALRGWFSNRPSTIVHVGDNRGAENAAWHAAYMNHHDTRKYTLGKRPRNVVVDMSEVLIALPATREKQGKNSLTWQAIRRAKERKIPVVIIWKDGSCTEWWPK